ncbi:MAG: SWIM zinc finger family protein [Candidatus Melainabacteria bacterium]|jgi:SWIM zinc finger|nr:SWIM zinc finger family protein [Candidatus Melainabacteria bacterium]
MLPDVTPRYDREQVLALAPDAASSNAGQKLASSGAIYKTHTDIQHSDLIIGQCQGSGARPYIIACDLSQPAIKCTCPSRKFPCKHGIALLLVYTDNPAAFADKREADAPVKEWFAKRRDKLDRIDKVDKAQTAPKTPEEVERNRLEKESRQAERLRKINLGVEDLDRFLQDVMREGLATMRRDTNAFNERAGRLIDAQAPGLARYVTELGAALNSGDDFETRFFKVLGPLVLLINAFKNRQYLPDGLIEDLYDQIGINRNQQEILNQAPEQDIVDDWYVVSQNTTQEDRLKMQRNILWGRKSGKYALILYFAHGASAFAESIMPGAWYRASLAFYPSQYPYRAIIRHKEWIPDVQDDDGGVILPAVELEQAYQLWSQALASLPWLNCMPIALKGLRATRSRKHLMDNKGRALAVSLSKMQHLDVLSVSNGRTFDAFGEFDGRKFDVLCIFSDHRSRVSHDD